MKKLLSPYILFPTVQNLNSMRLHVRVPVLSVKMCWICPRSSFKVLSDTLQGRFLSSLYIPKSLTMKYAWASLTISSEMISEIGIIVFRSKKYVQYSRNPDNSGPNSASPRYQWSSKLSLKNTPPMIEAMRQKVVCKMRMIMMFLFTLVSIWLCLNFRPIMFCLSLVSSPVYTVRPIAQSVLRSEAPHKRICLALIGKGSSKAMFIVPSNSLILGLGV
mmetsp:Transcript_19233/g.35280  ORF Transcript_19233/g.35280 Transcript_19233/m.35280 type:complete len:218 (-) Transcript_19233:576-1229(-)